MRLIDADAFKEQVVGAALVNGTSKAGEKAETIVKLIDSQPTAYDVDKVECELHNPSNYTIMAGKHYTTVERAVNIVRSGATTERAQSKESKYMQDREEFFGGADFLKKRFLEVK